MVTLKGNSVYLRALEPEDIGFLYAIENETEFWHLSQTQTPYSKHILQQYLDNAKQDIYEAKQLRLAICKTDTTCIGLIDVFDFNPKNKRAGIGLVIKNLEDRQKGFGKEALELLINYCFKTLHLHQVYANVSEANTASLNLFKSCDFTIVGLKTDWSFNGKVYANEYLLQRIES